MSLDDIIANLDGRAIFQVTVAATSALVSTALYFSSRIQYAKANKVEEALPLIVNEELRSIVKDKPLMPYVAITGHVNTNSSPLISHSNHDRKGVIWNKVIKEHKEVWGGYASNWRDNEKEISNVVDFVPFYLTDNPGNSYVQVNIVDPMDSKWTMDTLDIVHEEFKPVHNSVWDTLVGYLSGDRVKGYTDTEKMLTMGTQLYGFGELVLDGNTIKLRKPSSTNVGDYIITSFTPEEVKKRILSYGKWFRVFSIIFGGIAALSFYFAMKKWFRNYKYNKAIKKEKEEFNEVKKRRTGNVKSNLEEDNICTICLTNPRECVLLNCGHVCVCVDCYYALPDPKSCPMCRERIVKTVPLFHA